MNLPIFTELINDQSNYINFSKSLSDLDYSIKEEKPYFISKMVALNIPNYLAGGFFIDLNPLVSSTNPNLLIAKAFQYYTENIIRQQIDVPEIAEIAFWKTLKKFGMTTEEIKSSVVFMNDVVHSAFHRYENNNGWSEIIGKIPNKCGQLTTAWTPVNTLPVGIRPGDYVDDDSFFDDNADKNFDFSTFNEKIDFGASTVEFSEAITEFDFNLILLFYKDNDGVEKLHGVNFINPFSNQITHFELPRYNQRTNDFKNIGYQFKFNLKTVNNADTRVLIESQNFNTDSFWAAFENNISRLNETLSRFHNND